MASQPVTGRYECVPVGGGRAATMQDLPGIPDQLREQAVDFHAYDH